jgi:putative sugar O-methyltransferase
MAHPMADAGTKSALWAGLFEQIEGLLKDEAADSRAILHRITEFGCYTFPRGATDAFAPQITADYLAWLKANGTPLASMPPQIAESPYVHPSLVFTAEGREVSTMLLFHLCIAMRLAPHVGRSPRVLEIGGGYGGLARILKLLSPQAEYTIIDLPESLRFSRLFLQENFPGAHVASGDTAPRSSSRGGFDFRFVPAEQIGTLRGESFDVVINTCSFGEMTQETVDAYLHFVQAEIDARHLYSINRFGLRPFGDITYQAPRSAGPGTASMTLFTGPDWDARVWDCWNEGGFGEIEIAAAPYLEILLARASDAGHAAAKAARLLDEAQMFAVGSGAWHYCMFNALRYYPTDSALREYCSFLEAHNWLELDFFRSMSGHPDTTLPPLIGAGVDTDAVLWNRLTFTRLNRVYDRRIGEKLAELQREIQRLNNHAQELRDALDQPRPAAPQPPEAPESSEAPVDDRPGA